LDLAQRDPGVSTGQDAEELGEQRMMSPLSLAS
jgi:hypothetical protein